MTHRTVLRFMSGTLVAALLLGCGDNVPDTGPSTGLLQVDPLYAGIDQGTTTQLSATKNGSAIPVTWTSSDPSIATVSPDGVVTAVATGRASITASAASDPTEQRSASITVLKVFGTAITSGVPVTGVTSGTLARDDGLLYRVVVPEGATSLTVSFTGGTGDGDIYVQRAVPPDVSGEEDPGCHSYNAGNDEECTVTNPEAGTWYIFVAVYDPYAGATLTATVTP
jgi:carboxypeptidase T